MTKFKNLKTQKYFLTPVYCLFVFALLFIVLLEVSFALSNYNPFLFQCALFFSGWFAWTFLEYMSHRYLMHQKKKDKPLIDFNHKYHHSHPTEIKISRVHRCLLISGCAVLIWVSAWLNNYFTLAAGILCGFPAYAVMHFFLHQKAMQPLFKKMINYHIYHHCKYPDKCFGISVTWWDDLFGTTPKNEGMISPRIIDFYFNDSNNKIAAPDNIDI